MTSIDRYSVVYLGGVEQVRDAIAATDVDDFVAVNPFGRVFQCIGEDRDWLVVRYGTREFRASRALFREAFMRVPNTAFEVGQTVRVKEKGKCAVVENMVWHHGNGLANYYLRIEGKRASRRYYWHELEAVADA